MAKAKDDNNASICPESNAARGFTVIHLPEEPNDGKLITIIIYLFLDIS